MDRDCFSRVLLLSLAAGVLGPLTRESQTEPEYEDEAPC